MASLVFDVGQLGRKNEGKVIDVSWQKAEKMRDIEKDRPVLTHYYEQERNRKRWRESENRCVK